MRILLLCLAIALAAPQVLAAEPAPEAGSDQPAAAAEPAPAKEAAAEPAAKPASDPPATAAADSPKADAPKPAAANADSGKTEGEAAKADAKPKAKAVPFDPEPIDDQARFLAGLPVPEGSPLYGLQQTKFWKAYAKKFDADWDKLHKERLDAMGDWAAKVLAPKIDPKAPVYYLFGGPDFLSVPVLYPEAPLYILGGLEPVGRMPPSLRAMGAAALEEDMRNLRSSLNSIIRLSFFKTNDMREDLVRTELRGVVPLLLVLAARADAKVLEYTRAEITDTGELKDLGATEKCVGVPGARLKIQRNGSSATQEVLYFKHDVSDPVIKAGPGFLAFFKKHAPANTFLKAASFLLHRPKQFGLTRDFLVENSKSILQDDSGLSFDLLAKGPFELILYGKYLRPRPPFTNRIQPDMTEAFNKGPVEPLPFLTGYRKTGESNLVLAISKSKAPAP
ncbi:MAG TPA: hypothetical protein VGK67_28870 [Myxococcales bacterium]|jgi:hypothetical protein